jgi:transposase
MARARLSMRRTHEILRQKWCLGRSHRAVAHSLGVSVGKVSTTLARAQAAGLTWSEVEGLAEAALEVRLYGAPSGPGVARPLPDFETVHAERRRPGVTLQLLHLEYLERHPEGYGYTQFCHYYRRWLSRQKVSMRQVHRAGEKTFLDYSGKKPQVIDAETGECREVELFVAVLGASSLTFAEATESQRTEDFLASHVRAFESFGGVTELLVPDQLRTAVGRPCRYEPGAQRSYEELAQHYGTAILPARPRKPRDKAKAEVGVQVVQRWILARLRDETFFSLAALNRRIGELQDELNDRPMRAYGASRRELFERTERAALRPLPPTRYSYGQWKTAKVNIDYHVALEHHAYSVPFQLVHEAVDLRYNALTVEVFHRGQRVASHLRSSRRGGHTTHPGHMPHAHRQHLEWTPSRLVHWGASVGPKTAELVEAILRERTHPEQGYRSCLGILRLAKRYGHERLEAACTRAVAVRARSYRHVASMLKHGLDRLPLPAPSTPAQQLALSHENVRGGDYYHSEEGDPPHAH